MGVLDSTYRVFFHCFALKIRCQTEIMTQEPFLGEEQVKTLYIKAVGVKSPCLEKLILIFSDTLEHDFR